MRAVTGNDAHERIMTVRAICETRDHLRRGGTTHVGIRALQGRRGHTSLMLEDESPCGITNRYEGMRILRKGGLIQ